MKALEETQTAIGCGKPQPIFLYWPGSRRHMVTATSKDDCCGDPYIPGGIGQSSVLLCGNCGTKFGIKW